MNSDQTIQASSQQSISLSRNSLNFIKLHGRTMGPRYQPLSEWTDGRRARKLWPYSRVLMGKVGDQTSVAVEKGDDVRTYINFGSQDYLGIAQRQEVKDAVSAAMEEFGVHSAGSAILCGRTRLLLELEEKLATLLGKEECILFPTGWGAGFSVLAAFVRPEDTIVMDALSHNCLQEGARHATQNVRRFHHNDMEALDKMLKEEREKNPEHGLFLVLESLYSMDSDSPDLPAAIRIGRKYEAVVIVDVAHDLGALGRRGLGLLETVEPGMEPDLIMGSFSKTFAANGGFIACSKAARDYVSVFGAPYTFSNAISPMQTAVVSAAFDIIYSAEGDRLRSELMRNVLQLREGMTSRGMTVAGTPSAICPVFVGSEKVARIASKHLMRSGLLANLVEFPAVARGAARFRFQVMATHQPAAIEDACKIMQDAKAAAEKEFAALPSGKA
jgi:7-keto-8-aminopelargonate synthetase-like enzyme